MVSPMRNHLIASSGLRRLAVAVTTAMLSTTLLATNVGPIQGYKATDATSYSFIDVAASGGASVLTSTDDGVAALALPFGFSFYGTSYSNLCVSSNGAAYFSSAPGACAAAADFENTDLSNTPSPGDQPSLFPLWSDLVLAGPGAGVFYQTQGVDAGSRKFIVQWNNAYPLSKDTGVSPNAMIFEMILFEGSNQILFQYKTVDLGAANLASKGAQATIGIRDAGSVDAPPIVGSGKQIAWSYKSPVANDGTAILFTSGKSAPVVTATGGQFTYDGSSHAGTGAAYGTLAELLTPVNLTYESPSYPKTTAAPKDAGSYSVTAAFDGNEDYSPGSQTMPLVINQGAQIINFTTTAPVAAVVNGAPYDVQALGGGSGNPVTFSTSTPTVCIVGVSGVQFIAAGSCTIDADQTGDSNYLAAAQNHQSFQVGQGTQSTVVVTGPGTVQYNSTAVATASGGNGTGAYSFDAGTSNGCSVSNTVVSVTDASKSCVLTATRAGDANFLTSSPSGPFTVTLTKATQEIVFTSTPPSSPVALGPAYVMSVQSGGSGNAVRFSSLTATVCSVSGSSVSFLAGGLCEVAADQDGNNNYVAAPQQKQSMTVGLATQAALSVTGPSSVTFGTTGTATSSGGSSSVPVTFSVGASLGCSVAGTTVSVVNASALCALTATKGSDGIYAQATSSAFTVTLLRAGQAIAFTSTPPAPIVGGPTYTVTADGGASGNPVLFKSLTTGVCTVAGNVVTFVAAGGCQVAANQDGNDNYLPANQVSQTMTVASTSTPALTTTTVGSSSNPSLVGQSVTFTATVKRTSNNAAATGGTVTFNEGATVLAGPLAINGAGQASFTLSTLVAGTHSIAATYSGTATLATSTGTFSQVVAKIATTTVVVSSKNPSNSGQSVTFTATVRSNGRAVTSGKVMFKDGSTTLGGPISVNANGTASITISNLSAGNHQIAAIYGPTDTYEISTGTLTQTVKK